MPRPTIVAAQTIATAIVIRSRLRSATDEPLPVDENPPPNMSDNPPPLPLCSSTSAMREDAGQHQHDLKGQDHRLSPFRSTTLSLYLGFGQGVSRRYFAMATNSSGSSEAPPMSPPSMSG